MLLNQKLVEHFRIQAEKVTVQKLCIGLGYTAVQTSDGGMGVAYTFFESKLSCQPVGLFDQVEGQPAIVLLEKISSTNRLEKSAALALVNALNYQLALSLPEDRKNKGLFEQLEVRKGTRVAMVGFFGPMMKTFHERGALLEILDDTRKMGRPDDFYTKLETWADVLFLTSTSILNGTTEEVLEHTGDRVRTVMLGPSTPMVAEAFSHLPVHFLAGTVPIDQRQVLRAICHGAGTPVIHRFSRKAWMRLG